MKRIGVTIICVIVALSFASANETAAQEKEATQALGFTVSPSIKELYLREGDEYTGKIAIEKEIDEPIPVTIEKAKYVPLLNEDRKLTEELKEATDWVKLETNTFILEGTEKRDLVYHLKVPDGSKPGTYFTSILFQPILPDSFFEDLSVHILPYIGGVIVVNVVDDNLDHSTAEIKEFNYRITQVSDHDFFHTKIVNESDFYKEIEGQIIVQDFSNGIVDQIDIDETRMLPKEELDLNVIAKKDLSMGVYSANIILSEGEEVLKEDTRFFVFDSSTDLPKVIVLGVIIGSILFVSIKMIVRRRKSLETQ